MTLQKRKKYQEIDRHGQIREHAHSTGVLEGAKHPRLKL